MVPKNYEKDKQKRKKKERERERRILSLKVIFVDVIMKWPPSMRIKRYVSFFSTSLVRKTL
jgi:hypothetical protein